MTTTKRKPRMCPQCDSRRVARILYGMPAFNEELRRQIEEGEVVLGGCCVSDDDPAWQCVECGEQINRE